MSIKDTIGEFRAAKLRKEKEARMAEEAIVADSEAKKALRAEMAKEVENHLLNIVLPILDQAALEITESSFSATVEKSHIRDPKYGGRETFVLRLKLSVDSDSEKRSGVLKYRGNFSSVTIQKSEILPYPKTTIPIVDDFDDSEDSEDGALAISQFSPSVVQRQVEDFVAAVFKSD